MPPNQREYECVVLGATGYTGKYTAEHIASHLPSDFKWAIAGRSEGKLKEILTELQSINPDRVQPSIEVAQLNADDLTTLAKKTQVLISTVGPYHKYGTAVFEACAKTGTHYLDCTGEIPWVYDMVQEYQELAKKNSAIMIPQNGVESAPADLICWMAVSHLRQNLNVGAAEVVQTAQLTGRPSGGTLATALSLFESYSLIQVGKSSKPWSLCPETPPKQNVHASIWETLTGIRKNRYLGILTDSLSGAFDRVIVHRTWGLIQRGKYYGPNFHLSPYMTAKTTLGAFAWHVVLALGAVALVTPPLRWLIKKLVYEPGQGPSKEQVKKDVCEWRAVAEADTTDTRDRKYAYARLRWPGSVYHLTGVFLAEAAVTITRDKTLAHQLGGGVLTPATLGDPYLERLQKAGLETEVKMLH